MEQNTANQPETNFRYFKFNVGTTIQIMDSEFNTRTIMAVPDDAYSCRYCALKELKKLCLAVNCSDYGGFHFITLKP